MSAKGLHCSFTTIIFNGCIKHSTDKRQLRRLTRQCQYVYFIISFIDSDFIGSDFTTAESGKIE